ncbi:MAG: restriction endonuclease subunit S [Bacteroidales bacterium]|nr:restriction endonuclease subunit S [Bacteroidales bacterium]
MSEVTLTEICELIVDCPHTTANDEGKGYPLVRTPNIGKGRLIYAGMHRVSKEVYDKRNARAIPQEDDLIFAREATAGNVALIQKGEQVCLGQRTVLIRPNKEKVVPAFLTYFLLAPQQQYNLLSTANGATVAHVNLPTIRNLKLELPPMEPQYRIATILSRYDSLIENHQKQIKLLEEAAQRLYKEWFIDLRFPGHENTNIIDGVPEGWEKKKVGDLIAKVPRSKQIPTKDYQKEGAIPIIDQSRDYIAGYTDDMDSKVESNEPYIVFGDHTRILKYVPFPFAKGADGTQLIMSNNLDLMPQCLLFASLVNVDLSNYSYARHFKYLKEEEILVPTSSIATIFCKHVVKWYSKIQQNREQLRLLADARDRLLPKLMSGEITI